MNDIQSLLTYGPWLAAIGIVAPVAGLVIIFIRATHDVPSEKRAEVIRAVAELVKACRRNPGRSVPYGTHDDATP